MVVNNQGDTDASIFQVLTNVFFCFSAGKQISSSLLYLVARC
jgi:hypothetical protein